ncbi:uncharacterized protein LOC143268529 [Peromyscus maniculatus bairdii]|uniref:uncharacterized protein LOC143268529 n=1 Tax=Peromyscus maniculatus bairdii TaxID=230844 RepID=UPI003FD58D96
MAVAAAGAGAPGTALGGLPSLPALPGCPCLPCGRRSPPRRAVVFRVAPNSGLGAGADQGNLIAEARGGADMGTKQSGPAANGRTRAYSGSDLPSGGARARARRPPARLAGTRAAEARGDTGGARGGAGDQPDPGGGEPAAAQAALVPATPHSRSLGGAVDSAMGGRAAQSAAAAQADTGCGRDTQAGPGMGSARDRPLAGDPQRCATTGSGPIWESPPIDAKDGAKTPACREQLNRPVMPHPFKIGDSV